MNAIDIRAADRRTTGAPRNGRGTLASSMRSDAGKRYDRDRAQPTAVPKPAVTLTDEIVIILHVGQCDTEHSTVGRDQRQIDTGAL